MPDTKIYDIDFIGACVCQFKITDLVRFRLGPKLVYDKCVACHFLFRGCKCPRARMDENGECTLAATKAKRQQQRTAKSPRTARNTPNVLLPEDTSRHREHVRVLLNRSKMKVRMESLQITLRT